MQFKNLLLSMIFLICALACSHNVSAQSYSILELDTDPTQSSRAVAINQKGEVAGTIWNTTIPQVDPNTSSPSPQNSLGHKRPDIFIYSRGKTETFTGPGFWNETQFINAHGDVAGIAHGSPMAHVDHPNNFIFSQGKFSLIRDLLPHGNTLVFPYIAGYNDKGQILYAGLYGQLALLDHNKSTYLKSLSQRWTEQEQPVKAGGAWVQVIENGKKTLIFQPNQQPVAHDLQLGPCKLNNKGHITGKLANGHLFLYADGVCTDIGVPPGLTRFDVAAFNDNDEIVGIGFDNRAKVFSYSRHKYLVFAPEQQGAQIKSIAVNDHGVIVGALSELNGAPEWGYTNFAFIIQGGKMTNLNDFIDPKAGWVLEEANGINDKGQIVGAGQHIGSDKLNGSVHAVLLTPLQ